MGPSGLWPIGLGEMQAPWDPRRLRLVRKRRRHEAGGEDEGGSASAFAAANDYGVTRGRKTEV